MSTKSFDKFIDTSRKDIWRYAQLLDSLRKESWLAGGQREFTALEKVGNWQVKREDQSFTGSHKFRSLEYQLSCLLANDVDKAVLSSSGNAAISASRILPEGEDLKFFVFLSKKTAPEKLAAIQHSPNLIPILSSKPLRLAKYTAKHFKMPDLRPSVDPNAKVGFRSLGFEIFEQNPNVENIFSFATSFASMTGIQEAFEKLVELGCVDKVPNLFAVVSSGQLAGGLSGQRVDTSRQAVDKLKMSSRQKKCPVDNEPACRQAGRQQWTPVDISDKELEAVRQKYPELETSNEGLASLAAAEKINPKGESLVILTGKIWPDADPDLDKFLKAENFSEVDKIVALYK